MEGSQAFMTNDPTSTTPKVLQDQLASKWKSKPAHNNASIERN